jgi:hypothetical protein
MSKNLHPSHETRISMGSSSWDEICVKCGYTDRLGSWGKLAEPCIKEHDKEKRWK